MIVNHFFSELFPTPSFFAPHVFGISFDDTALRIVRLHEKNGMLIPVYIAEEIIPEGCLVQGNIEKKQQFISFLKQIKKQHRIAHIRVALPDTLIYSFTTTVPKGTTSFTSSIEQALGDHTPLKKGEATYDSASLSVSGKNQLLQITAMAKKTAKDFFDCFTAAGITPIQFEPEAHAVARTLCGFDDKKTIMSIAMQSQTTSISIMYDGAIIFSTTLQWGSTSLAAHVAKHCFISFAEAQKQLRTIGFSAGAEHADLLGALHDGLAPLQEIIKKFSIEWNMQYVHHEVLPPLSRIFIAGMYSVIPGYAEYIGLLSGIPTTTAEPWARCFDSASYIPRISKEDALRYTSAIGAALNEFV